MMNTKKIEINFHYLHVTIDIPIIMSKNNSNVIKQQVDYVYRVLNIFKSILGSTIIIGKEAVSSRVKNKK